MEDFKQWKDQIRNEIHLSKSIIHFSFNIWTSSNSMAMIAIVAHYISCIDEVKDYLLGLKHMVRTHSGENMVQSINTTIENYRLQDRIGKLFLTNY